jgi:peptidoglycan/LPS O-acetylase OafA/YrhL
MPIPLTEKRMSRPEDLQTPQGQQHIQAIDGLKGFVICILLVHYNFIFKPDGLLERIYFLGVQYSLMALDIFFVVSGFLITGILIRSRGHEKYFRNFYARRSLRIFPLYYVFLVLYFFLLPALWPEATQALRVDWLPWFFGYGANIYMSVFGDSPVAGTASIHLWSLSVEEQYYLIWPLVVHFCSRQNLKRVSIAMIVAAPLIRVGLVLMDERVAAFMLMPSRMDSLAIGGLLAMWSLEPGGLQRFHRHARLTLAGALATALPILLYIGAVHPMHPLAVTLLLMCASAQAGALVLLGVTRGLGSFGNAAVTWAPLARVGLFSYAIYVLHDPAAWIGERMGLSPRFFRESIEWRLGAQLAYFATFTVISFGISWCSWHFFEKHLLELKRYFPYQKAKQPGRLEVPPTATGAPGD